MDEAEYSSKEENELDEASFLIQVKFQRNSTWQGSIKWIEENKTQNFRSVLEMIKLMDDSLQQDKKRKINWD